MVKFMVAVDESLYARNAFFTTLDLMRNTEDMLYVITVVSDLKALSYSFMPASSLISAQEQAKRKGRNLLYSYAELGHKLGVTYYFLSL